MKKISTLLHILSISFIFLCLPTPFLSDSGPSDADLKCYQDHKKKDLLKFGQSWGNQFSTSLFGYQVQCDPTTNRIISLSLFTGNLSGQIPAAIGDFPSPQTLVIHKLSGITGTIPSSITKLTHLTQLTLSWLNLSGPIPSFLGALKNLILLDLSFNQFTGSIPPSLGTLPNILQIQLSRNFLTGTIPASFGQISGNAVGTFSDGLYLDLSHNQLTGSIPASFGKIKITSVDLSRNKLTGDVSVLFGANKTLLQSAILDRNEFQFDLTHVVFPADLSSLDLNHNNISGSLPAGLTGLRLSYLNVSYNRLCGQIPVGGKLQSLGVTEYFHNKCLCGAPLPAC